MPANPILAHFIRGSLVENRHRGAVCVSNAQGDVLASLGDVEADIFPRSAIKAMQAMAIFESGANVQFGLSGPALALACASHNGEPQHTEMAASILSAIGLDDTALECGVHAPIDPAARKNLFAAGDRPTALHNSCSGKHAGMLSVARALEADPKGYSHTDHPVQQRVKSAVEAVLDHSLSEGKCGTDGCSIPTWAAPIRVFAKGFARMVTGEGLSPAQAQAATTICDAATQYPFLVGGTGNFDTEAMEAFGGRLMLKFGADGVYCGALRDRGIGFALKCDDGSVPAATAMVAALLLAIAEPSGAERTVLETWADQHKRNWTGLDVGALQATPDAYLSL